MQAELLPTLKTAQQDFEFYPTTEEILRRLGRELKDADALLDIGAGNGKVLEFCQKNYGVRKLLAIEKSEILLAALPKEVLIAGTDFHQQSLFGIQASITYCNPPYKEFEEWAAKIIRQSSSSKVYLLLPTRWSESETIADALKFRDAKATTLGTYSFEQAEDRQARATTNLIRIEIDQYGDSAFNRFFDEQFQGLKQKFEAVSAEKTKPNGVPEFELIPGRNYPETLVEIYQAEMAKTQANYERIGELDPHLLEELGVDLKKVRSSLKEKIDSLRTNYWVELFNHLSAITSRLTNKTRQRLLTTLQNQTGVEFSVENIYAVVIWAIKNANAYFDEQLVETYELMVEKANVFLYKSNQKTWVEDRWRYATERNENSHFALDYRIVTHRVGGFDNTYSWLTGLSESAAHFVQDLLTIAKNLGFDTPEEEPRLNHSGRREWKAGSREEFHTKSGELLLDVKAFQNGNVHLRLNKKFIRRLNVEYGRLRGWLKTPQEAAEELKDPEAATDFECSIKLLPSNPLQLCGRKNPQE